MMEQIRKRNPGQNQKDSFFLKKKFKPSEEKSKPTKEEKSDDFFIAPSSSQEKNEAKKPVKAKKPFDKKKWRLERYSKKFKLQQWEEKRKKVILREYENEAKTEGHGLTYAQKIYETEGQDSPDPTMEEEDIIKKGKKKGLPRAHLEYQRMQDEKEKRQEDWKKRKEEKEKAIALYKKNKLDKMKKLSKKTKKGQPIMKYRMEMLLEQIEKQMSK